MIWKEIDLFNIAKDIKPKFENSTLFLDLSSVPKNGHKENKNNKKIECIRLSGIADVQNIVKKIEISLDNKKYILIDDKSRFEIDEAGRLEINLHEEYEVKFIRILICGVVDNLKVEVLNRKFPGLVAVSLSSGWGDRLISMLHAMTLAQIFKWKFAFKWVVISQDLSKNNLVGQNIADKETIFSKDFIEKYHYETLDRCDLSKNSSFITWHKIKKYDFWGGYTKHDGFGIFLAMLFPKMWQKIGFSDDIKALFEQTNKIINDFRTRTNKDFVCLHVRSGDIVYLREYYILGGFSEKVTPTEIAMFLIEKYKDKNIILFSDDTNQIKSIKEYYTKKNINIYLISEILPTQESKTKLDLQEIIFMSKAKKIICSGSSGFARLPSLIGCGREPSSWKKGIFKRKQFKILNANFGKIPLSNEQNAFSKYYIYLLHKDIYNNDWIGLVNIIQDAIKYMPDNVMYKWMLAECYVKLENYESAQNILKEIKEKFDISDVLESFNHCHVSQSLKATFFPQKSLEWKLGEIIMKKSLFDRIKLPFVLVKTILKYNYALKRRKLKFLDIEKFPEYDDVLRYRNEKNFKLGSKILKIWNKIFLF